MATTDALGTGDLELGYWLSSEEHAPAALVEHAVAAESAGFRTAMISDHLAPWLPQQGQSGFVWAVLGGIASRTSELRVGTGVTATVHRMHPLLIAHAAATVETMMPGRFFLGLGTGERLNEHAFATHWPRPGERRRMLEEALVLIRRLWSGASVSHDGRHYRLERARLWTLPDTAPPIVVAAGGRRSAQLAGEHADGMLGVAPEPSVVDAFEAAGGRGKPRLAQIHVCWAESDEAARKTVLQWWPNGGIPPALLSELALPSEFAAAAERVTEADALAGIAYGPDPERYVDAIVRFVAAGFTTIHLHQIGPDQQGFLDFHGRELAPRFVSGARHP
jgi:G6PDH family F420-dependent oxidoreductase